MEISPAIQAGLNTLTFGVAGNPAPEPILMTYAGTKDGVQQWERDPSGNKDYKVSQAAGVAMATTGWGSIVAFTTGIMKAGNVRSGGIGMMMGRTVQTLAGTAALGGPALVFGGALDSPNVELRFRHPSDPHTDLEVRTISRKEFERDSA